MLHVVLSIHVSWNTKRHRPMSSLLPPAPPPQAAYLRSPPRLLRRGLTLSSSSSSLWLFCRLLPGPLPSLPPRSESHLLCFPQPWSPLPTQEVGGPRTDHPLTQTESLHL